MPTASKTQRQVAVIDLGSNAARLMTARYVPGYVLKVMAELRRRVRLSEGMGAEGRLQPEAMRRTVNTLRAFTAFCRAGGIRRIIPVATAAVRDAANRQEFLARVRRETGLRFRVLEGEVEGYYGFLGVVNGLGMRGGLVLDVGGGSAAVSQIRGGRFKRGRAFQLGAVRLTEQFLTSDPVRPAEFRRLTDHIAAEFEALDWMRLKPGEPLVGVGGTARSLAHMERLARQYPLELLNGYEVALNWLQALIRKLRPLPVGERLKKAAGLQAERADIILAGAMVIAGAVRRAAADRLVICTHGLREGLVYHEFLKDTGRDAIPNLRRFSVLNLARHYDYDAVHAGRVAQLALSLFDQLQPLHGGEAREREWLWAAAQLHDIGGALQFYDAAKHSAYLILSGGLPGYTHAEAAGLALLCLHLGPRPPSAAEMGLSGLIDAGDERRLAKLAALLSLAAACDASRTQPVKSAEVRVSPKAVHVTLQTRLRAAAGWELEAARQAAPDFEKAFGRRLEVAAGG